MRRRTFPVGVGLLARAERRPAATATTVRDATQLLAGSEGGPSVRSGTLKSSVRERFLELPTTAHRLETLARGLAPPRPRTFEAAMDDSISRRTFSRLFTVTAGAAIAPALLLGDSAAAGPTAGVGADAGAASAGVLDRQPSAVATQAKARTLIMTKIQPRSRAARLRPAAQAVAAKRKNSPWHWPWSARGRA